MANLNRNMALPGIASATGTRVDSAAKHTMACRLSTPLLRHWARLNGHQDPDRALKHDKMTYCVHKNELAMNCGTPLDSGNPGVNSDFHKGSAYPPVVSTVCATKEIQDFLIELYGSTTFHDFKYRVKNTRDQKLNKEMQKFPLFHVQGYALTMGHASPQVGDTMCTCLVGGMITVPNGAFPIRTGQMVQWYFEFEEECFNLETNTTHDAGQRTHGHKIESPNQDDASKRKGWTDRQFGPRKRNRDDDDKNAYTSGDKARMVFRIKPYVHCTNSEYGDHFGDKIRVFAKCIAGGRPYDDIDIMLMTQSL